MLEEVLERLLLTLELDPRNPRLLTPSLSLECKLRPAFPQLDPFLRRQPRESSGVETS